VNSFQTGEVSFLCEPRERLVAGVPSCGASSVPSSIAMTQSSLAGALATTSRGVDGGETCSGWLLLDGVSITIKAS